MRIEIKGKKYTGATSNIPGSSVKRLRTWINGVNVIMANSIEQPETYDVWGIHDGSKMVPKTKVVFNDISLTSLSIRNNKLILVEDL